MLDPTINLGSGESVCSSILKNTENERGEKVKTNLHRTQKEIP